jgi:hypothetical protein
MRKVILTVILATGIVMLSNAQDYKTGLGLRFGNGAGFTVKHFVSNRSAIEGFLFSKWHGFDITGLYEVHDQAFDVEKLKWFYGFGAHLGFYDGDYVEWGDPGYAYNVFGVDGIVGLEYSFTEAPINLGLDLKPALNLVGYTGLWIDFGLSVRYIF